MSFYTLLTQASPLGSAKGREHEILKRKVVGAPLYGGIGPLRTFEALRQRKQIRNPGCWLSLTASSTNRLLEFAKTQREVGPANCYHSPGYPLARLNPNPARPNELDR